MNNSRYELKFPFHKFHNGQFFKFINSHINLSKIYEDRIVNSIYFDCYNGTSIKDNIIGLSEKNKFRLRWYENGSNVSSCSIEIKKKYGRSGTKLIIPTNKTINQINLDKVFHPNQNYFNDINKKIIIDATKGKLLIPKIKISYLRKYYLFNKKIRITYDKKIIYSKLNSLLAKKDDFQIMEIKFSENDQKYFYPIMQNIPFTKKRFSKYLRALAHFEEVVYI